MGHEPVNMPGANVIICDSAGRLLFIQRRDNGQWGLPGGGCELGERVEDTARREALEESGLRLGALELLGVYSGPEQFHAYPNGDQVYNVTVTFVCYDYAGEPQPLDGEALQVGFFQPEALPGPIVGVHRLQIADFLRRRAGRSPS